MSSGVQSVRDRIERMAELYKYRYEHILKSYSSEQLKDELQRRTVKDLEYKIEKIEQTLAELVNELEYVKTLKPIQELSEVDDDMIEYHLY